MNNGASCFYTEFMIFLIDLLEIWDFLVFGIIEIPRRQE